MNKLIICLLGSILFFLVLIFCRMTVPLIAPSVAEPSDQSFLSFHLAMQANQFAMLQVYLSAFGIFLTGLGIVLAAAAIWGYKELREIALKIAENKINAIVPDLVKKEIKKLTPKEQDRVNLEVAMEKSQNNNSSEIFKNFVTSMNKDPLELPSEAYVEDK